MLDFRSRKVAAVNEISYSRTRSRCGSAHEIGELDEELEMKTKGVVHALTIKWGTEVTDLNTSSTW